MIWKQNFPIEGLNQLSENTLVSHLEIKFTRSGDDFLEATMPVTSITVQPMRILHGGASVVLAETLGSVASSLVIPDLHIQYPVGLDINANHLRSVKENSIVTGRAKPIHLGKSTHVWHIDIYDENQIPVCVSRLTMMIKNV